MRYGDWYGLRPCARYQPHDCQEETSSVPRISTAGTIRSTRPRASNVGPALRCQRPNINLDLLEERRELAGPLHRLVHRPHFHDGEAGDELLRFGERPVQHRALAPSETQPLRTRDRKSVVEGKSVDLGGG